MLKELKKTVLALLKKPYAVTLLSICAGTAILFIGFKIFIAIRIPEKQLKTSIEAFFKENFNKAVDFEDISLSIAGNAVISNLNVSISSDFNDNLSLIKTGKAIIKFDFTDLLGGTILVREIVFKGAEIKVPKKYGQAYPEFFREVFRSGRALADLRELDLNDFSVLISGGRLNYLEGFRDSKLDLEFTRVNAAIVFSGGEIRYRFNGKITPSGRKGMSAGSFLCEGRLRLGEKGSIVRSSSKIEIDEFDVSFLNLPLMEYLEIPWSVYGAFSVDMKVESLGEAISAEGSMELDNISIESGDGKGVSRIISNENVNARFSIDLLHGFKRIVVRNLEISDDSTRLSLRGVHTRDHDERSVDTVFRLEASDLRNTATVFSPLKHMTYEGRLDAAGRFSYDFLNNRARELTLRAEVRDFSLRRISKGKDPYVLKDLRAALLIRNGRCDLDFRAGHGGSDVSLQWSGFVRRWAPFTSRSRLTVGAKRLEAETVGGLLARGIDRLVDAANEDKGRGYEEIYFKQKPLGAFVSNNTLDIRLSAESILFNKRKGLQNLLLDATLADGMLRKNEFRVSGYDGQYICEFFGYLNSDHPNFKIEGRFTNINLERLCRDYRVRGVSGGTLNIELEYEANGYRLAHLLDNGKLKLGISINGADLRGTRLQGELKNFLGANGYENLALDEISLERASVLLGQQGGIFSIGQLACSGSAVNVTGYGGYSYAEGMRVPLSASLPSLAEENTPPRMTTIPLVLTGPLLGPSLSLPGVRDARPLPLFNID